MKKFARPSRGLWPSPSSSAGSWPPRPLSPAPHRRAEGAPLRFAWLSDLHIGSDRGDADLRASVADINALPGLSFVLVTGDITEMGSFENLSLAKQILDGLRIPYHIIPGNHDTKWSESGGSDFARLWGADRFSFDSGGFRFIGLSQGPVLRMGDGNWAPQDVRWLEGLLSEQGAAAKPTIFVSHYPLDPSISNWYVVLDKLKTIPTVAVLVGHGHRNQAMDFEGLRGVMGRANVGTKDKAPGYTVVEIGAKAMTFAERTERKTLPAWQRIELEKGGLPVVAPGGRRAVRTRSRASRRGPTSASTACIPRSRSAGGSTPAGRSPPPRRSPAKRSFSATLRAPSGPCASPTAASPGSSRRAIRSTRRPTSPAAGSSSAARTGRSMPGRPDRITDLEVHDGWPCRRQPAHRRQGRLHRLRRPRLSRHRPGPLRARLEP